jgi:hypothetical protein
MFSIYPIERVYEDAVDVALFDMSLNQFFAERRRFVEYQLKQETTRSAVSKIREARQAGLADVPEETFERKPAAPRQK